jgi:hypothetical protein
MIDPKTRKLTAFISHMGVFEFLRMPFGLCNAGATFQRAMERMLHGITFATAYIDDILVSSRDFQGHIKHLDEEFRRIKDEKLKMKPKKCTFGFKETKFLGFIVSESGIKVCPSRNDCIANYPTPKTSKQVRSFLGLASYYRKFIDRFADVASPLTNLTKKKVVFHWDNKCEDAFRAIIKALLNPPILVFPDFSKRFKITTDASNVGLGAVLSQDDDDGNDRVIGYASRTLQPAEKNYSTTEQEMLAIVWALERYRPYVYGVSCDVVTDHKPLTYNSQLINTSQRLTRWKLKVAEYSPTFHYKEGKENTNADALSRIEDCVSAVIGNTPEIGIELTDETLIEMQDNDPEIANIKARISFGLESNSKFILENGILYASRIQPSDDCIGALSKRLFVPNELIEHVLTVCHDDF